jgi:hypothetical protein
MLTDFSFIEDLVNETILRRQKHQYKPDIEQYRLSLVEEVSETSATPKGSSGSPISRRSLRGSTKSRGELIEESPLNDDIFKEELPETKNDDVHDVQEIKEHEEFAPDVEEGVSHGTVKEMVRKYEEELEKEQAKVRMEDRTETELKKEQEIVTELVDQIFEPINQQAESEEKGTNDAGENKEEHGKLNLRVLDILLGSGEDCKLEDNVLVADDDKWVL